MDWFNYSALERGNWYKRIGLNLRLVCFGLVRFLWRSRSNSGELLKMNGFFHFQFFGN